MKVASANGVKVELHDLGGHGPTMLLSHANGFHGLCWTPVAAHLTRRFHCYAHDHRGHGDTELPKNWKVAWAGYGADASAAANAVREDGGIIGVGHSMGGATLLMAAVKDPSLLNSDPFGRGWLVKLQSTDTAPLSKLMDAATYDSKHAVH